MTDVKPVQMYQQPGAAFAQQAGGQVVQVIGQVEAAPVEGRCCCCGVRNGLLIFLLLSVILHVVQLASSVFGIDVGAKVAAGFSLASTLYLVFALFRERASDMNIAKWVFTAVQAIAVIVSLAVSIVAVNAIATEFCDSALDAGISNDTCVSDASNALIPGVAASIGFQALLIGIIANRAFAYHTYLLQMDAYNARVQTGQHIKLNQVVVNQ